MRPRRFDSSILRQVMGLSAAIAAFVLTAAAYANPVKYQTVFKSKFPAASQYRTIGIMPFQGEDAENFTGALVAELQKVNITGEPYFKIQTEDGFAASRPTEAEISAAVNYGRKVGAEVVYIGRIGSAAVRRSPRKEQRSQCVQPGEKLFSPCQREQSYQVDCENVSITYTVTPRAIKVADGSVVYSNTISVPGKYDHCADSSGVGNLIPSIVTQMFKPNRDTPSVEISTPEALLQSVRQQVVAAIRADVAPSLGYVTVDFKERAPEFVKEDQAKFKSGLEFAKAGRADRACGIWDGLNTGAGAQSPTLLYNLGACAEITEPDNPRIALGFYSQADALLTKPDSAISAALNRMRAAGAN